jgi:hypothetical protein
MKEQDAKLILDMFVEDAKKFNFNYHLSTDLEKWKKGVNEDYLMRKKVAVLIDSFGGENTERLLKIILNEVPDNLMYGLVKNTLYLWFLPYIHTNKKSTSTVSEYQVSVAKTLKNKK